MNNTLFDDQDRLMSKARLLYRKIKSAKAALRATKANRDAIAQPDTVLDFQKRVITDLEGEYAHVVTEIVQNYTQSINVTLEPIFEENN